MIKMVCIDFIHIFFHYLLNTCFVKCAITFFKFFYSAQVKIWFIANMHEYKFTLLVIRFGTDVLRAQSRFVKCVHILQTYFVPEERQLQTL